MYEIIMSGSFCYIYILHFIYFSCRMPFEKCIQNGFHMDLLIRYNYHTESQVCPEKYKSVVMLWRGSMPDQTIIWQKLYVYKSVYRSIELTMDWRLYGGSNHYVQEQQRGAIPIEVWIKVPKSCWKLTSNVTQTIDGWQVTYTDRQSTSINNYCLWRQVII